MGRAETGARAPEPARPAGPSAGARGLNAVGHVVREWLPRSATFVHTLIRHQRRVRPAVFAGLRGEHAAEFPVGDLVELGLAPAPRAARALRHLRARAAGHATTYDHRLARAARARACIALHAHFGPVGEQALPATRALGVPLVTTFYGFDLAFGRHDALFAEAAALVVEGPAMAERLVALGAPRERVEIVRIGLDLELFPFRPRPPAGPLMVLQAARLVPKKGVDVSLRAFAAARPALPGAELRILGDGPLRAELERLADALGIASSVRFLGSTSYEEYRAALAGADVCLQPSRTAPDGDTEGGAPTVLLEMQAAGVPVVATRHADIPAVVADPAWLAEEEDVEGVAGALRELAGAGPQEWLERARRGRAHVEREHDARRTAARMEDLYLRLAARGGST